MATADVQAKDTAFGLDQWISTMFLCRLKLILMVEISALFDGRMIGLIVIRD